MVRCLCLHCIETGGGVCGAMGEIDRGKGISGIRWDEGVERICVFFGFFKSCFGVVEDRCGGGVQTDCCFILLYGSLLWHVEKHFGTIE